MTDAKGLSEENARLKQSISRLEEMYDMAADVHKSTWGNIINICNLVDPRVLRKPGEERPDFQAVEQVRMLCRENDALAERLKACLEANSQLNADLMRESSRYDQLTAELEELKLRLKMEAECHEQTVGDLERARAEVQRLNMAMPEYEECCDVRHKAEQSNERLMGALVEYALAKRDFDARRLEDDSEWPIRLKRLVRAEQTLQAQAALKETP